MEESNVNDILSKSKKENIQELKVSADPKEITPEERKRRVKKLAGAIGHALRTNGEINVRAFGAEAIYKAIKALAIAKDYISATNPNLEIAYAPAFIETDIESGVMTGICFCTFANTKPDAFKEVDLSSVKSVLMVKADPIDLSSEDRKANVRKLAGAITHAATENSHCLVRAFGKTAAAKAAKALAIARGFVATKGLDLYVWNSFVVTNMDKSSTEKTGIVFYVFTNQT